MTRAFDACAELDVGLLDALLHVIPHDSPQLWFGGAAAGFAAYPNTIERLVIHRPRPRVGVLSVTARPLDAAPRGRFVRIEVSAEGTNGVWLDLTLREVLMPKGPLGALSPADRRAFLAEGRFVPGAGLSRVEGEDTLLAIADVRASDWLPGTLAAAYGLAGAADAARAIAIKEHAARVFAVHPWTVAVDGDVARSGGRELAVTAAFDTAAQAWRISTRKVSS
jgi:hypothetical protein